MGGVIARPTPSRGAGPLATQDTDHAGSVSELLPYVPARDGNPLTCCRVEHVGGPGTGGLAAWSVVTPYLWGGLPP